MLRSESARVEVEHLLATVVALSDERRDASAAVDKEEPPCKIPVRLTVTLSYTHCSQVDRFLLNLTTLSPSSAFTD